MVGLLAALDRKRVGTHYSDRMHRILGACDDCNILWHHERVTFRNGSTEVRRVDDIEPVGSVVLTPQYEKYGLRVNPRVLRRLTSMGQQFAYALNVSSSMVEVDGNVVYVRVPREDVQGTCTVTFDQAWAVDPQVPAGHLLLGLDEDGKQVLLNMTSPANAHAAVIGMTGSGKSTLMRTMILSAQKVGGAKVALFDPTGGFEPLAGHPSVWRGGLFQTPKECEAGLAALVRSLGRRPNWLSFVFVDEVPELVSGEPNIKRSLARLAQAGRHAGIHLVIGAQHPLASELGSSTLRNIAVRIAGRVSDRTAAYNATGRNDSGADSLRGRGDFVVGNGGALRHFQAAIIPEADLQELAASFPPRPPRLPIGRRCNGPSRERPSAGPSRGVGRPADEIPEWIVRHIRAYTREHGKLPSSNWVYKATKASVPAGGFNRQKAQRALDLAQGIQPTGGTGFAPTPAQKG